MNESFDPGPVPVRPALPVTVVRHLVADQFPQWADLTITPVAESGWDNRTFRLGREMVVRLPSAAEYALAVEKERRWLPFLAPRLPLPIPVPLGHGRPAAEYPHPWSVLPWIDGETAVAGRIGDPVLFAEELAAFLVALRGIDATGGPQPGLHNWFRGGPLLTYDAETRTALDTLTGQLDVARARAVWERALGSPWDGVDRWFHGDVSEGNLLVTGGRLSAVIDFGTCGVGDPACDLVVAWTLLTEESRAMFRDRLAVDPASWSRGRGWALWKALITCAAAQDDAASFARASGVIDAILGDAD